MMRTFKATTYPLVTVGALTISFHLLAFGIVQSIVLASLFTISAWYLWNLQRQTADFNHFQVDVGFRSDRVLRDMGLEFPFAERDQLLSYTFVAINPKLWARTDESLYGSRMWLWTPLTQAEVPWIDPRNFLHRHAVFYLRHDGTSYTMGIK